MYGYIYKTTCLDTNKIYVGQKKSSKFKSLNYLGSGLIIQRLVEKYNKSDVPEKFTVEMIDTAESQEELN